MRGKPRIELEKISKTDQDRLLEFDSRLNHLECPSGCWTEFEENGSRVGKLQEKLSDEQEGKERLMVGGKKTAD